MTAFSDAPPFGATNPTAGAGSTVWTKTANFDKFVQTIIQLKLEEQLRDPLPFLTEGNWVKPDRLIARGKNGTARFLAIGDLAVDVSDSSSIWTLIEGEPNDTEDLDLGYEEFSVKQAQKLIRLTDVVMDTSPVELVSKAAGLLALWKMQVANAFAAKILLTGDNIYLVGGGTTAVDVSPSDTLTGAAVVDAVAEARAANIPTFPNGNYRAFIHPFVAADLMNDTRDGGWIDAQRYATPSNFIKGELGTYMGVQFIDSRTGRLADAGASSNDVYVTPLLGPGALALEIGANGESHFTPPGGHDDPNYQSAILSWIGYLGGMVVGEGDNASGPVSGPRYLNIYSGTSKSTS
jgi:N4-gp56 family major capsid protein